MISRIAASLIAGAIGFLPLASVSFAQSKYPDQAVKIVVALPAGGGVDAVARALGQKLNTMYKQPFLVDNRPGGSGQIGMPLVAKAAPDGYTLTVAPAGLMATNKSIFKSLAYDPEADFAPITRLVNQPMVLIVRDKQKFPTVAAFLAAVKANPGKITYASSGDGTPQHLGGLMFTTRTQTQMLHVPYRGGALAINDLLGGTVDSMVAVMTEAVPFLKTGKLHALAVMNPTRSALFPQVPTMAESGIADLNLSTWIALLAPAKTPRAIIDQLNRAVQTAFDAEFKAQMTEIGNDVALTTPEELQRIIARDIKLHAELVKAAGLVPQ
jgi:tripartite-type tricarboxylate transporter receptor subunit TctC